MTEKDIFNEKINTLLQTSEKLSSLVEDEHLQNKINNITKKIETNSLHIGVTGVIKAGKSTLLNALMSKDILGTSIVPETANITIIKHSETEKAKVFFWDEKEWQEIVESAKNDEKLNEWLNKTCESIENLSSYIKNDRLVKDIAIEDLPKYTSAKRKYKSLCNLVKYVELYSPLKYLENGVNIVDTPGIDDPVIRREHITQKFLNKCDVMVHAMNASQALTNKDATFIIDNIIAKDIYKLILVITRKDDVSGSELSQVITHVKSELINKFNDYKEGNKSIENKIKNITDKIEIVAISGKDALNHRIGKDDKARLSIEESGINLLENTLDTLLFKENPKHDILFTRQASELINIINNYISILNFEESNKSKSIEEINIQLNEISDEKKEHEIESKCLVEKIKCDRDLFKKSLNDIYNKSIANIEAISIKVNGKVNDYVWKAIDDEDKPDEDKIKEIIETTIKSNVLDVLIRHEDNIKHESKFHLKDAYKNYPIGIIKDQEFALISDYNFDFDKLFGDSFFYTLASLGIRGAIGFSVISLLTGPLGWIALGVSALGVNKYESKLLKEKRSKQIDDIDKKLEENLAGLFNEIKNNMEKKLQEANKDILDNFNKILWQPYNQRQHHLEDLEKILKNQIENNKNKEEDLHKYRKYITQKHKELQENMSIIKEL